MNLVPINEFLPFIIIAYASVKVSEMVETKRNKAILDMYECTIK